MLLLQYVEPSRKSSLEQTCLYKSLVSLTSMSLDQLGLSFLDTHFRQGKSERTPPLGGLIPISKPPNFASASQLLKHGALKRRRRGFSRARESFTLPFGGVRNLDPAVSKRSHLRCTHQEPIQSPKGFNSVDCCQC